MSTATFSLPVIADRLGKCSGGCCRGGRSQEFCSPLLSGTVEDKRSPLLEAPDQVLSTLNKDGRRRWLKPKLSQGKWWHRRRLLAYVLMVVFIVVPHLRVGGGPLVRIDILAREFTFFGHTFLPTDTLLLALLIIMAFVGIFFVTAVTGRAWCGWACPQTVYIEYLFRPLDRLFEGTVGKGGKPKKQMSTGMQILRFALYLLITSVLAHTFLAYFVGPEKLATWLLGSPFEHPVAFVVMAVTTGLLTYDFFYFREQTCLIACPYGRFQSVMLDRQSLIVAYDPNRGEPRAKGKRAPGQQAGDCVDCNQCVVVCPTGIDIRDGLQMECINCTQCIDACDSVMDRIDKPRGLIRYSSQTELERQPWRMLRARTFIYPAILVVLAVAFAFVASTKFSFDARVIRGRGAPFNLVSPGRVLNNFSIHLVNRSREDQTYQLSIVSPEAAELTVVDPGMLELADGRDAMVPIQIEFPSYVTSGDGNQPAEIMVVDASGHEGAVQLVLLGPR